jgi:hypothetical protein
MAVINMDGSPFVIPEHLIQKKAISHLTEAVEILLSHGNISLLGNIQTKQELK